MMYLLLYKFIFFSTRLAMLNTFENCQRHHLRRLERERHLKIMDTFSSGLDWTSDSALCSAVDELAGFPLERNLHEPSPPEPRRRNRKYKIAGITVAVCIGLASLGFLAGKHAGVKESLGQVESPRPQEAQTLATNEARRMRLLSLILDWNVTSRGTLEVNSSAPARALDWLVSKDNPNENVQTIRTQFALATLFFSTQSESVGKSWTKDSHWLSSYPVCLWYGVECLDENSTIGLVKAINLSSNGLIGTLPRELGLLELDCNSLDVSNNAIAGTIPETLFLMKNLGETLCLVRLLISRFTLTKFSSSLS